jgi:hypothetical protein
MQSLWRVPNTHYSGRSFSNDAIRDARQSIFSQSTAMPPMTNTTNADAVEHAQQQRTLALRDAIDMTHRAASAAAACAGEQDTLREAVLQAIHQRLSSLLAQLQALE